MSQVIQHGSYCAVVENQTSLIIQRLDGKRMEPEEFIRLVKGLDAEGLLPEQFALVIKPLETS